MSGCCYHLIDIVYSPDMASQGERRRSIPTLEVKKMSLQERLDAIEAGVIEDITLASPEAQAFAERATQRYLANFGKV